MDILDAIKRIDQDDDAEVPIFAAVNFDRVPKVSPVQDTPEATSARLDAIEKSVSQLCQAISKLAPTTTEGPTPTGHPPANVEPPPVPVRQPAPNVVPAHTRRSTYSKVAAVPKRPGAYPGRISTTRNIQLTEMSGADHDRTDSGPGFRQQYAAAKTQRRRAVVGSRKDDSLKSNEPLRHLFVYRLSVWISLRPRRS